MEQQKELPQKHPLLEFMERYGAPAGEEGPVNLVKEVFGATPDPWQEEVLRAWARGERRISIASCHGPGKTTVASWLVWCMLLTRFPQKTVATAPSRPQLEGALLPEIKIWGKKMPESLQKLFDIRAAKIYLVADPESSYFESSTARAERPEALQGKHSANVLLIADEASAVPDAVYEAAIGSMSDENATTLLISNPTRTSGYFYDSHHKNADIWFRMKVSHADSPRVVDSFVDQVAREYGRKSTAFRVRCLGEFPLVDEDTIIPFELVDTAQKRDIVVSVNAKRVWGLDVARFGGDRNVLVKRTARGLLPDIQVWEGVDLMVTAGKVKAEWDSTPPHERPETILVDVIGLGAGVVDRLRELGLPVRAVNVSEAPASDRFLNQRAELWWKLREWLDGKDVTLPPPDRDADQQSDPLHMLYRELVLPRYTFSSAGKIKMESKDEIKKRTIDKRSPDLADALALTFAENLSVLTYGSAGSSEYSWGKDITRDIGII